MTQMDDVIRQIETVIDDDEYPATLGQLMAMKRILAGIARQCAPATRPAASPAAHRFFPGGVYDSLRDYERRRYTLSLIRPAQAAL